MKTLFIAATLLSILFLSACQSNNQEELFDRCNTENLVFDGDIRPILSSCVSCHNQSNPQGGIVLDSEEAVAAVALDFSKENTSRLLGAIQGLPGFSKMPPDDNSMLSECDIEKISTWVSTLEPIQEIACDTINITYSTHIQPMLNGCVSCHNTSNPSAGIDLSTEEKVIEVALDQSKGDPGLLLGAITGVKGFLKMPPEESSPFSDCDITQLSIWIKKQTPVVTAPDCDTTSLSYDLDIKPILQSNCLSCHSENTQRGGIDLSTEEKVLSVAQNTSKGAEGLLIGAITKTEGYSPMPPSGSPLSDCQVSKITAWVRAQ
ncbi:c-type cytochrome domain-containing protein [Algivirga pacifica]|uniref:Cytochrome c domain-containing protein n=1 Tax=Algivirga pacifica TaxID=1162670 RepID=A0ABP9D4A0_9BACT